jgi:biotin transport system substrate-specific component
MAGPTGGYLAGFLIAAMLLGWLTTRGWDRRILGTLAAMLLGTLVIFALGFAWLATLIGAAKAVQFGVLPFLPAAALKIALAAALLPWAWKLTKRSRG